MWVHQPRPRPRAAPPWRPAVFGVGSTFQGDVALPDGTVFTTDADRFLFRADLTECASPSCGRSSTSPEPSPSTSPRACSVTVLGDGTALAGEATSTFGGLLLAVPPGSAPSMAAALARQPPAHGPGQHRRPVIVGHRQQRAVDGPMGHDDGARPARSSGGD